MRIVQVIDSLETGGAERMAVNFANALSRKIEFSGLVATREQGSLKSHIDKNVNYLFLKRKRTVDFPAAMRLRKFCVSNRVEFLHAHSSSYFVAMMVKMLLPRIKIIWHDHNGMSEFLGSRESMALKMASFFFSGIIVVNHQLKKWAIRELKNPNVKYFANFTQQGTLLHRETTLKGNPGKKILCLANLREQKNHMLLVEVAEMLAKSHRDWTFHVVGKDFHDDYSAMITSAIAEKQLESQVFLYGSCNDTEWIISQSEIAILTSKSEGLPVALLEFGLYKKPVVVTGVGEIPLIIRDRENGLIVPPNDADAFYNALVTLIEDEPRREKFGIALYETIVRNHSEDSVITKYLKWLEKISHV